MAAPYSTLLLDTIAWDLVLDVDNNIAVASAPYALAQDAASAIKLFSGELWYDTTQGIPYFQTTLGKFPSLALLKQQMIAAALSVPAVTAAQCFITGVTQDRVVTGQVQITSVSGTPLAQPIAVGF
jgi:hypothetical protein